MSSIEGVYIKRKKKESEYDSSIRYVYEVEPYLEQTTCDFSLLYLVGKILPICNNHDRVLEFVNVHSQFEYGQVSQALCGAIQILLKEYLLLVTQLDTEFMKSSLTLQQIWFFIQPSMRIMENLYKLTTDCVNRKGGALLNVIYKYVTNTSDKPMKELFSFLLEKTSVPFLQILQKWIYSAKLEDPYGEFLIVQDKKQNKDNIEKDFNDCYWQKRYTYNEEMIPVFLQKLAHKILHSGKYLSVFRECGSPIEYPDQVELIIRINQDSEKTTQASLIQHKTFSEPIEKANEWASKKLIEFFFKDL